MEEKKVDRRVRRTQRQLRMALTTLMMEKDINKITVHEIAELADVNRGTFYSHYKDVGDLLNRLEEGVFTSLTEVSRKYRPEIPGGDAFHFILELLTLVDENADICKALMCNNGDMHFKHRLFLVLKDEYFRKFLIARYPAEENRLEYFCTYLVSGILSVTRDWLCSSQNEPPIEIAYICADFIMKGVAALK
ncbi:MAG TPA: TetR/AcrR family transcriptional regulator [Clostridiales bacterium]|nr:TetR/AcrR family transcriptional regulator [Clostridiales bacterium]HBR08255.1 TetR/AcrR family transcriptional regulator [Clostridiales bacterium]